MCGRKVQDINRIGQLHGLRGRDVFYSSRVEFDMNHLSNKFQLVCRELSLDELHMQHGLFWYRWRSMYCVHCRNVQDIHRISPVQ